MSDLSLCKECGMTVEMSEYHPYAACLMFKACHDGSIVRANLDAVRGAPPAPIAERIETTRENIARDIREGRFPQRSDPQMVRDPLPAPKGERADFHDKAWAMWQARALGDALLPKLSVHTIRTLWDALYDSMPKALAAQPTSGADAKDAERMDVMRQELLFARARYDRAVTILTRIHGLLSPRHVRLPDGRIFEFNNAAIEHEMLHALSEAIRSVPDELEAIDAAIAQRDKGES